MADLLAVLTEATRAGLLLVFLLALAQYLRRRSRGRLYVALTLGALAAGTVSAWAAYVTGPNLPLTLATGIATIAQPFLLVWLVAYFRPVPWGWRLAAAAGMAGSWALLVAAPVTPPGAPRPLMLLLIVAYFVLFNGYGAAAFLGEARRSRGSTRWRMVLVAAGALAIAAAIFFAGIAIVDPKNPLGRALFLQSIAFEIAVGFYLGFTPPAWLRRIWRNAEFYRFMESRAIEPSEDPHQALLERLARAASSSSSSSGMRVLVAVSEKGRKELRVAVGQVPDGGPPTLAAEEGALGRAWSGGEPVVVQKPSEFGAEDRRIAAGAGVLVVVPVSSARRRWGLLVLALHRPPLFLDDQVEFLALLGREKAVQLDLLEFSAEERRLVETLQASNLQLETANRELERFSYSISHDLRAPLRAIDGFSRILLDEAGPQLPPEALSHLDKVRRNARQMGQLIDDLLVFARLGRQPLEKRPVDPAPLVQEALDLLRDQQEGRRVEWVVGDLPSCRADPALLKQVFVNLLSNSLKFTRPREAARIEVGCETGNGRPTYYVRDNGVGFDMRYVHKLFGVFQRLHRPDEFEGTGVGLAIVQNIVQRHGGRVWAEGEVDRGSVFRFTLEPEGGAA